MKPNAKECMLSVNGQYTMIAAPFVQFSNYIMAHNKEVVHRANVASNLELDGHKASER